MTTMGSGLVGSARLGIACAPAGTTHGGGAVGRTARRPRLLVIDDEEDIRDSLRFFLERAGFDVETADGGATALELVRARSFDVAITDLRMPGMSGVETITALKALDATLPIVVATGYGSAETEDDCARRGASGYVRKPFDLDELIELARRLAARGG